MMMAMIMVIMGPADDHDDAYDDHGEVVMIITMKTNATMVLQSWAGAAATTNLLHRGKLVLVIIAGYHDDHEHDDDDDDDGDDDGVDVFSNRATITIPLVLAPASGVVPLNYSPQATTEEADGSVVGRG